MYNSVEMYSKWLKFASKIKIKYIKYKSKLLKKKLCLLVTNDLSLTGAPIVLLEFAKVCKELGYIPVIVSEKKGPLEKDLKK